MASDLSNVDPTAFGGGSENGVDPTVDFDSLPNIRHGLAFFGDGVEKIEKASDMGARPTNT